MTDDDFDPDEFEQELVAFQRASIAEQPQNGPRLSRLLAEFDASLQRPESES